MPVNKYRLQPVIGVRERAKQEAMRRVAALAERLAEAEAELSRRKREVEQCREQQGEARAQMWQEAQPGAAAGKMVGHRTHLAGLRLREEELLAAVEQQQQTVARAEAELERSRAELIEAAKELQVLEKHRERWREAQQLDARRREQKINDEIGLIKHGRKGSGERL